MVVQFVKWRSEKQQKGTETMKEIRGIMHMR